MEILTIVFSIVGLLVVSVLYLWIRARNTDKRTAKDYKNSSQFKSQRSKFQQKIRNMQDDEIQIKIAAAQSLRERAKNEPKSTMRDFLIQSAERIEKEIELMRKDKND